MNLPKSWDRIPLGLRTLATREGRLVVEKCDVVIGVDMQTGKQRTFYGSALLERSIEANTTAALRILKVPIDFESEADVQVVAAACLAWKGSYDVSPET